MKRHHFQAFLIHNETPSLSGIFHIDILLSSTLSFSLAWKALFHSCDHSCAFAVSWELHILLDRDHTCSLSSFHCLVVKSAVKASLSEKSILVKRLKVTGKMKAINKTHKLHHFIFYFHFHGSEKCDFKILNSLFGLCLFSQ